MFENMLKMLKIEMLIYFIKISLHSLSRNFFFFFKSVTCSINIRCFVDGFFFKMFKQQKN